ncbi:MAG: glycosyltransferase family 4 protein [Candidatus Omnitrophica bacterium]|nr:glycosyltransferase family 4 protein [Candidatus Omnitrophota bacterium]
MKIAIVAPPWIPVPPPYYGGIELVVYNLAEGLTALGHEVLLFAPKDSNVSCRLFPYLEQHQFSFGLDSSLREKILVGELAGKYAYSMAAYEKVDIIHSHTILRAPENIDVPIVHTLHGPANEVTIKKCVEFSKYPNNYFVAISNKQRANHTTLSNNINFIGTIHNSINVKSISWSAKKEDFFLFVGRVNWEKGLDLAIRVANKSNINLVMAIKMSEDFEKEFFKKEIKPLVDQYPKGLLLKLHEDLPREMILDLYRRAKCTLFTSQWEEPFGLVMIESMACGTPVIGLRRGAVPEVIVDGKTGFVVDTEDEMVRAIKDIDKIKPKNCRKHVEENYSREKMAENYIAVYKKILSKT